MAIYVGSSGVSFTLTLPDDLTDASSATIVMKSPEGVRTEYSGTILSPATDKKVRIVTGNDFLTPGKYRIAASVMFIDGGPIWYDPIEFLVSYTGVEADV